MLQYFKHTETVMYHWGGKKILSQKKVQKKVALTVRVEGRIKNPYVIGKNHQRCTRTDNISISLNEKIKHFNNILFA